MIRTNAMEDMAKWAVLQEIGMCRITCEDSGGAKKTVTLAVSASEVTADAPMRAAAAKISYALHNLDGITLKKAEIFRKDGGGIISTLTMNRKISLSAETLDITMRITEHGRYAESLDWVAEIVRQGEQERYFEAGEEIRTEWKDVTDGASYENPFVVLDAECSPELEDGSTVHGMMVQQKYASGLSCPFSAQEAFLDSESGLAAGSYYFTVAGTTFIAADRGRQFMFTLRNPLPAGGQLVFYNPSGYSRTLSGQVLRAYSGPTSFTTIESITLTEGSNGIYLGATDGSGELNPNISAFSGSSEWDKSMLRKYLNSGKPAGQWWEKLGKWDRATAFANSNPGYMAGFPADFLSLLKPVKVKTLKLDGTLATTFDTFFPLSANQNNISGFTEEEGQTTKYWTEAAKTETNLDANGKYKTGLSNRYESLKKKRINLQTSFVSVCTRTIGSTYLYTIIGSGSISQSNATGAYYVAPACVICGRNEEE